MRDKTAPHVAGSRRFAAQWLPNWIGPERRLVLAQTRTREGALGLLPVLRLCEGYVAP